MADHNGKTDRRGFTAWREGIRVAGAGSSSLQFIKGKRDPETFDEQDETGPQEADRAVSPEEPGSRNPGESRPKAGRGRSPQGSVGSPLPVHGVKASSSCFRQQSLR